MPRINLLPWREELQAERQQQFYVGLGVSAAIGIGTAYAGFVFVQGMIDHQNARNNYLRDEIKLVDEKIKEINELQATKQRLISRMQIIEQLQTSRPEVVHLFDEMVRTLPEGAYLNYIKQTASNLEIRGSAESSARVSAYMRNIDSSEWISAPALTVIQAQNEARGRRSTFTLRAKQRRKGAKQEGEEGDL